MLGAHTQVRLADFIKAVADWETGVEITRQVLAEKKSFEPQAAFDHLDVNERGYLTVKDILSFLNGLDVFPTEEEVRNLIKQYTPTEDEILTYEDFENMVLPVTSAYLAQLALSRGVYQLRGLTYTSAWALARVFDKEIKEMRKVDAFREDLLEMNDWDPREAFETIDYKEQGFLTPFNILEFLRTRKVIASYDDVLAFMRKADKDEDRKVSYREFEKILQPSLKTRRKSPSPKKASYGQFSTSSLKKSPVSSPVKNKSPGSKSRTGYSTEKTKLTDQDYNEYLETCNKKSRHTRNVSMGTYGSQGSQKATPKKQLFTDSWSKGPSPGKYQSTSKYDYSREREPDPREHLEELRARYTIRKDYYSTPKGGFSTYQPESSYASGIKATESQWVKRKRPEDVARRLEFGETEEYVGKPEESEEYDFTGYRATLGRDTREGGEDQELRGTEEKQPRSEEKQSAPEEEATITTQKEAASDDPYKTPQKGERREPREATTSAKEGTASSRKRSPAEYIISPRKERSPGRYSGAKTYSEKSPIRGYEEEYVAKALKQIIQYERELLTYKCELAGRKDFTVITSFRKIINEAGEGTTNQQQFEDNLRNYGVFFTQTEAEAVFAKFDHDGDGAISLNDYEHIIVPSNKDLERRLKERDVTTEIGESTVKSLVKFIKKFAEIEAKIEDLRVRISKRNFKLEDAFKAIDIKEQGFIDLEELEQVLTYHGVFPTEKDLKNIVNKIDTDNDGKLSVQEFIKGFSPVKGAKAEGHEEKKEESASKEEQGAAKEEQTEAPKVEESKEEVSEKAPEGEDKDKKEAESEKKEEAPVEKKEEPAEKIEADVEKPKEDDKSPAQKEEKAEPKQEQTVEEEKREEKEPVQEPKQGEEKPVEEKVVEEKPVEEKPVEEKPVEEKPVEEKPVEEKVVEEKPVEEKPVEEKPVEEKVVEEKPVEYKPVEENPAEEEKSKEEQQPQEESKPEETTDDVKNVAESDEQPATKDTQEGGQGAENADS